MQSSVIKPFSIIVASCRKNRGLGFKGGFPWPMLKQDLSHFARVTKCKNLSSDPAELAKKSCLFMNDVFTAD
jgi:hypothetical protein